MKLAPALLALLSAADAAAKKRGRAAAAPAVSPTFASDWLAAAVGSTKPWLAVPALVACLLALFAGAD